MYTVHTVTDLYWVLGLSYLWNLAYLSRMILVIDLIEKSNLQWQDILADNIVKYIQYDTAICVLKV